MADLLIFLSVAAYCVFIIRREYRESRNPDICRGCPLSRSRPGIVDWYRADRERHNGG